MAKRISQEDVDTDHKTIAAMADRLGLTGDAKETYVHKHMSKLGHRAKRSYVPGELKSDQSSDDDDFF